MNPAARAELEATALVRVEHEIEIADRPYLRFHPTLPYAAAGVGDAPGGAEGQAEVGRPAISALRDPQEARPRFIRVHGALDAAVAKAFRGSQPCDGMQVLVREEAAKAADSAALGSEEYFDAWNRQAEVGRMVGAVAIPWAGASTNGNEPLM